MGTQQPLDELKHVPKGQLCRMGGGAAGGDVDRAPSPRPYIGAERSERCFREVS